MVFCFLFDNSEGRMLCLGFSRRIPRNGLNSVKDQDADNEVIGPNSPGKQSKRCVILCSWTERRGRWGTGWLFPCLPMESQCRNWL